jgi:hypothetical protein
MLLERTAKTNGRPCQQTANRIRWVAALPDSSKWVYLRRRAGPAVFVLGEGGTRERYRVVLGGRHGRHACSHCPASDGLCVHVLFVMVRVLGLQSGNPHAQGLLPLVPVISLVA